MPDQPTANRIYMDNAATSLPKAPGVGEAMRAFLEGMPVNIGRGSYREAYDAEEAMLQVRELLGETFHAADPSRVILTSGATLSLNMALRGLLKDGGHVLISAFEHNAVLRTLEDLRTDGVTYSVIHGTPESPCDLSQIQGLLQKNTKAVCVTHASNVTGQILPIRAIGDFCSEQDILFIVDAAQTAGVLTVNMEKDHIDALCFSGHKGLLGPQGTGGLLLSEHAADVIRPVITGGTGSKSDSFVMPKTFPDRLEAGTLNLPGIIGLRQALLYLKERSEVDIFTHETELAKRFLQGLKDNGLTGSTDAPFHIAGCGDESTSRNAGQYTGIVSLSASRADNAMIAHRMDTEYGILTRVGLHCAPLAHKTAGTFPEGTIRFSFGLFNTAKEIDLAVTALREFCDA